MIIKLLEYTILICILFVLPDDYPILGIAIGFFIGCDIVELYKAYKRLKAERELAKHLKVDRVQVENDLDGNINEEELRQKIVALLVKRINEEMEENKK